MTERERERAALWETSVVDAVIVPCVSEFHSGVERSILYYSVIVIDVLVLKTCETSECSSMQFILSQWCYSRKNNH